MTFLAIVPKTERSRIVTSAVSEFRPMTMTGMTFNKLHRTVCSVRVSSKTGAAEPNGKCSFQSSGSIVPIIVAFGLFRKMAHVDDDCMRTIVRVNDFLYLTRRFVTAVASRVNNITIMYSVTPNDHESVPCYCNVKDIRCNSMRIHLLLHTLTG